MLADFDAYAAAQQRVDALFAEPGRMDAQVRDQRAEHGAVFVSDRSVREYADNIWGIKPVL